MHAAGGWRSLGAAVLSNLPLLLGITLAVSILETRGYLHGLETYALDRFLRLGATQQSRDIVLVTINDGDYKTYFHETSPLCAATLLDAIQRIGRAKPRVIGVDIDTSSTTFEPAPRFPANVIWGRTAQPLGDSARQKTARVDGLEAIVRAGILGGDFHETATRDGIIATSPESAVARFPCDEDGVVRRYARAFYSDKVEGGATGAKRPAAGRVLSFPCAVALKYLRAGAADNGSAAAAEAAYEKLWDEAIHDHESPVIKFVPRPRTDRGERIGRFQIIPFSAIVENPALTEGKSPMTGRIVLVGGTYGAGRDQCLTPVGLLAGVELTAEVIDAECKGRFVREASFYLAPALDIAAGLCLVSLNWYFRARWMLLVNLALIVFLSVLCSLIALSVAAYWFNFTAVLTGVWLHVEWDRAKEAGEMRKELTKYQEKFGALSEPSARESRK